VYVYGVVLEKKMLALWESVTAVGSKTCLIYIIENILAIHSISNDTISLLLNGSLR
jgi:hypothetical protein